jgi:hypothetical protein
LFEVHQQNEEEEDQPSPLIALLVAFPACRNAVNMVEAGQSVVVVSAVVVVDWVKHLLNHCWLRLAIVVVVEEVTLVESGKRFMLAMCNVYNK